MKTVYQVLKDTIRKMDSKDCLSYLSKDELKVIKNELELMAFHVQDQIDLRNDEDQEERGIFRIMKDLQEVVL